MNTLSYKCLVLVIIFVFSGVACAGITSDEVIENIKKQFIDISSADIEDYQVCELYSKHEDKKEFVQRALNKEFTNNMKELIWKELNFREEAAKSGLHLGVVVITYMAEEDAVRVVKAVDANKQNYLANSLILTRYIALRIDNKVAFVYSETFVDDKIKRLFNELKNTYSSSSL